MRIYLTIGIIVLSWSSFSVYATSRKDDCNLIDLTLSQKKRDEDPDLVLALSHLKAYCCKSVVLTQEAKKKSCEGISFPSFYPQSPYFFDHILDVRLRKVDAIGIYDQEGQIADEQGIARRKFLSDTTTKPEGVDPQTIQTTYEGYRKHDDNQPKLIDAYRSGCLAARNTYELYQTDAPINKDKYLPKCEQLIASRIKKEFVLTRVLMIQASTRKIENNLRVYTDNFSQNRLMSLADKFARAYELLVIVAKQAPLAKRCSK